MRQPLGPSLVAGLLLLGYPLTNSASAADPKSAGKKNHAIEERLRQLEDREQIRDLLAEYIRCLDARDHATYSQLFAKDGELTAVSTC